MINVHGLGFTREALIEMLKSGFSTARIETSSGASVHLFVGENREELQAKFLSLVMKISGEGDGVCPDCGERHTLESIMGSEEAAQSLNDLFDEIANLDKVPDEGSRH